MRSPGEKKKGVRGAQSHGKRNKAELNHNRKKTSRGGGGKTILWVVDRKNQATRGEV